MVSGRAAAIAIDGGDLPLGGGLLALVRPALDLLEPGGVLAVASSSRTVREDLPSWCRLERHQYVGREVLADGRDRHLIARGPFSVPRGAREQGIELPVRGGRVSTADMLDAVPMPDRADPASGFAPRGARVEPGGPRYPFTLLERDRVAPPEVASLYDQAVAAQWDASRDIPWEKIPALPPALEAAVGQVMTFLAENELSALYTPARFIARMHPYYAEVAMFIATQLADEARHIEAFLRRAQAGGQPLGVSAASSQASLKTLLEQEDFTSASFLLSVLGEGTFLDLLRYLEEHAPDPVTREIVRRARNDEARHVRFGVAHVRHHLASDPGAAASLAAAARDRARVLAGVTDVNPLVGESLAVLAAGSLRPADMRRGVIAARGLRETMHANRIKRLLACGFDATQADELSTLHTANFM